jgi:capsular exopolysaccharide synthesis family protein
MSRIHDALKKLEAERAAGKSNGHTAANGQGTNGQGTNGVGDGNARRGWQWLLSGMGRTRRGAGAPVNFEVAPEVEEAYQRLGTSVLASAGQAPADQPKLLGVVASRHGEGTTTTAAVFASILVRRRGGRVAVVECNLRTPSFDTSFGIRPSPGFAEVIEGRATLADAAQPTKVHNLFAIAGGETTIGPATLFDSPGLPAALDALRQQFEFVLLDLPPVNVYGDALILGQHLDAAVIVIEADATRVSDVERARRTLERGGVRFLGSVLNRRRNYIPAFLEEML